MIQHLLEKWDSYLSVLLGVLLIALVKTANPLLLKYFKFYVFAMIAVVIFDTISNFKQHESLLWKGAAILSNGVVLVSCIYILQSLYTLIPFPLPQFSFMALPGFMFYLGIFLAVENLLWIFVYDHF